MRRQSVVLIVSGVALLAAAAASLYWWHVQRPQAPPADMVEISGRPEFARIDIAVTNPAQRPQWRVYLLALEECLAWRGLSPIMTGVQP